MALFDTGWVAVVNGQTTQAVVPAGRIVAAHVRWRGKKSTATHTVTTTDTANGSGDYTENLSAAAGEGTLTRVTVSTSFVATPSGTWVCAVLPSGGPSDVNEGTGTSGSASSTGYSPSSPSGSASANHQYDITSWTATLTAYWTHTHTYQTHDPTITVNSAATQYVGDVNDGVETGWYDAAGFVAGASNSVLHTIASSAKADVQIQVEYIPTLTVRLLEPVAYGAATRLTLLFRADVVQSDENEATAWFLRLLAGQEPSLAVPDFEWDSSLAQTDWDYTTDGGANWTPLTGAGAPLNAILRFTPPAADMAMGRWYWTGEAWDDDTESWGAAAAIRQFRLVLSIAARFALEIDAVDYSSQARNITVSETTNGELGSMEFDLYVPDEGVSGLPSDGDVVALAVRDSAGTEDQFEGWLQGAPERIGPGLFRCYAKLPDAILAERYVREDYASQDVGQTLHDIVDEYCAPLDSSGIDLTTGFSRPVTAFGRTALDVAKELREQYGLLFWVRSTDSVVFLVAPADLDPAVLTVTRGQVA